MINNRKEITLRAATSVLEKINLFILGSVNKTSNDFTQKHTWSPQLLLKDANLKTKKGSPLRNEIRQLPVDLNDEESKKLLIKLLHENKKNYESELFLKSLNFLEKNDFKEIQKKHTEIYKDNERNNIRKGEYYEFIDMVNIPQNIEPRKLYLEVIPGKKKKNNKIKYVVLDLNQIKQEGLITEEDLRPNEEKWGYEKKQYRIKEGMQANQLKQYMPKILETTNNNMHTDINIYNYIGYDTKELMENISKNAVLVGYANCGIIARLAGVLLCEIEDLKNHQIPFEIVKAENFDHAFVIVGRDPKSDLNDMSTWGEDCYILDGWIISKDSDEKEKNGAIFHVQSELKNPRPDIDLEKIKNPKDVNFNVLSKCKLKSIYQGFVGEGHTDHWKEKRKKHNQPMKLGEWEPISVKHNKILNKF